MVQRVTVSPSEVRGYGDIVSPKTTEDFTEYMSELSESDGIYTMTYGGTLSYLTLSSSPTTAEYGDSIVFTATLTIEGQKVSGETVSFYEGETLLGTGETNSNGVATLTKSNFSIATHTVKAVYDELESNNVNVTVTKRTYHVTLSASPTTVEYGGSVVFTATLTSRGQTVSGEEVYFYEDDRIIGMDETDSNGVATLTKTNFSIDTHTIQAVYDDFESNTVTVTVTKITPTISLSSNKSRVDSGESFTLSGTLSVGSGVTVKLYEGNTFVKDLTTSTGGAFSETISNASAGAHTYKVVFEGNANYESVTSSNVTVTVLSSNYIELKYTGNGFGAVSPLIYTGEVFVDWGDNTVEQVTSNIGHSYASSGNYTIKIYGNITATNEYAFDEISGITSVVIPNSVTSIGLASFYKCTGLTSVTLPNSIITLGAACFGQCTNLSSISLPNSITTIEQNCFRDCSSLTSITFPDSVTTVGKNCFSDDTALTEVVLLWDSASEIVTYDSTWITGCTSFDHFLIPEGTKSLYTAKDYPSALLKEDGEPTPASLDLSLTAGKQILSYADVSSGNEYATLTATVLDENDDPVEGATVELYKDNVLWDTLTTSSAGTVSKTYTSLGAGDVSFKAECGSLVTVTFVVQDYYYYDPLTVDKQRYTTVSGTPVLTYNSNGLTVNSNIASVGLVRNNFLTLPSNYEAELTITGQSNYGGGICFDDMLVDSGAPSTSSVYKLSDTSLLGGYLTKFTTGDVVKIVKQGSTFTYYINDVQKWTGTITDDTHYQQFRTYQNRSTTFKDLKVKSL